MTVCGGLVLLGYDDRGHPIYQVAGGAGPVQVVADDGDEDELDDDAPDPDDEDGDAPDPPPARRRTRQEPADDDWKPPTREEWQRTQEGVRRNNRENQQLRNLRKQLKALGVGDSDALDTWLEERGIDPKTGGKLGEAPPEGDPPAQDRRSDGTLARRLREAEREAARIELKYKPALVKTAAEAALHKAGWTGKDLSRVMRLIDIDDVDVDDDGNVVGLAEQVEEVKAEFPEWFRRQRTRRQDDDDPEPDARTRRGGRTEPGRSRGTRLAGGGDVPTAPETRSWLDQLSEQMA